MAPGCRRSRPERRSRRRSRALRCCSRWRGRSSGRRLRPQARAASAARRRSRGPRPRPPRCPGRCRPPWPRRRPAGSSRSRCLARAPAPRSCSPPAPLRRWRARPCRPRRAPVQAPTRASSATSQPSCVLPFMHGDSGPRHAEARRSPFGRLRRGLRLSAGPAGGCGYRSSMSLSSFWIAGSFMFSSVTTCAGIATTRGSMVSPFRILSMAWTPS